MHFLTLCILVYGGLVVIVIMSLYLLFKTIGLNQMFSMGIGGLLKITLFFAYLGLFQTTLVGLKLRVVRDSCNCSSNFILKTTLKSTCH